MVDTIQLQGTGTQITTEDGRPRSLPTVMGIDMNRLVEAKTHRLEERVKRSEAAIDDIDQKTIAFSKLGEVVTEASEFINQLRGLDRYRNSNVTDVFTLRKGVTLSNLGYQNGSDYATIMPESGSPYRTIPLKVNQIATADVITATVSSSAISPDSMLLLPALETLTINGFDITTDATWSLNDLAGAINTQIGEDAHVVATVVGSGGSYRLELKPSNGAATSKISVTDSANGTVIDAMHLVRNKHVFAGAVDGNLVVNGVDISIAADMSLWQIQSAINSSPESKAVATIDQNILGDWRLSIRHTETGELLTLDDDQGGQLLQGLKLAQASGKTETDLEAQFELYGNGQVITRKTNDVSDVVDKATIKLIQVTEPGQELNLVVDPDLDAIYETAKSALGGLSALVQVYIDSETATEDGPGKEYLPLKGNPLLRKIYDDIISIIPSKIPGLSSDGPQSLKDLGVSLHDVKSPKGTFQQLKVDTAILADKIQTKHEDVRALLSFVPSSSNPEFRMVEAPSQLNSSIAGQPITVKVWKDANSVLRASFNSMIANATIDDEGLISGGVGVFAGLSLYITKSALNEIKDAAPGTEKSSTIHVTNGIFSILGSKVADLTKQSSDFGPLGYLSAGGLIRAAGEAEADKGRLETERDRDKQALIEKREREIARVAVLAAKLGRIEGQLRAFNMEQEARYARK